MPSNPNRHYLAILTEYVTEESFIGTFQVKAIIEGEVYKPRNGLIIDHQGRRWEEWTEEFDKRFKLKKK